jgi:hypothetical protein
LSQSVHYRTFNVQMTTTYWFNFKTYLGEDSISQVQSGCPTHETRHAIQTRKHRLAFAFDRGDCFNRIEADATATSSEV